MTQPEPININELKRLLTELFTEILDNVDVIGPPWSEDKGEMKRWISKRIDNAILNGDDS